MTSTRVHQFWFLTFALFSISVSLVSLVGCGGGAEAALPPPPSSPTVTLTVSPASVTAGSSATLTWSSTNASDVVIDNGVGVMPPNGSASVSPQQSTTYTATARGAGGSATASARVEVTPVPGPTLTISASPSTVNSGEFTTITWATTNVTEVTITPEIELEDVPGFPVSGSAVVVPADTTTYTATAKGPGGTVTQSTTVTVIHPAPKFTFTATPASIISGESATLTWTTEFTDSISIDQGIGTVDLPSGTRTVSPTATTTYTATATSKGGTVTQSATVEVHPPGELAATLVATPNSIASGQCTTLTWNSQNATRVTIDNGVDTGGQTSGSAQACPTTDVTYTATATDNLLRTATATARVVIVKAGDLKSKIRHIIFLMQENRSFDQYFGRLGRYRESKGLPNDRWVPNAIGSVDGLPENLADRELTDFAGHQVKPYKLPTVCHFITSPGWNESHFYANWDTQNQRYRMDNWMKQATDSQHDKTGGFDPSSTRTMGFYDETDLPYYYELATQFATSDRFFSSLMGPTVPNRKYLFAGTSFGHIHPQKAPQGGWPQKTFFELLNEHADKVKSSVGKTWNYYYRDSSIFLAEFDLWTRDPASVGRVRKIDEWYRILADQTCPADPNQLCTADRELAPVVFIEQAASEELQLNEHPSTVHGIQPGAADTKKILDALMNSTAWKSSIFVLIYDEAGGIQDHVPPVPMAKPDDIAPLFEPGDLTGRGDKQYGFDESGFRIPVVVVSPWVKKNFVSHVPRDFVSVWKLIQTRFDLPPLTRRDAAADDMLEFFDFTSPVWLTPPPLPRQPWFSTLPALNPEGKSKAEFDPEAGVCDKRQGIDPGHLADPFAR